MSNKTDNDEFIIFYVGPLTLTAEEIERAVFIAEQCQCGMCYSCIVSRAFLEQNLWRPNKPH